MPHLAAVRGSALRRVRLGPLQVDGHSMIVRNTRLTDFDRWREIRLRDREFIEPYWTTSALTWDQRHTRTWWIREYLRLRWAWARGRALPLSIVIDGEFAGQCALNPIDPHHRSAELGIWMDSRSARHAVGSLAGALTVDYAFTTLGLHRVTAPTCVDNRPARLATSRSGMRLEATMVRALSVGGHPRDHELWAVTTDQMPPGGWVAGLIAAGVRAERPETNRSGRRRRSRTRSPQRSAPTNPPDTLSASARDTSPTPDTEPREPGAIPVGERDAVTMGARDAVRWSVAVFAVGLRFLLGTLARGVISAVRRGGGDALPDRIDGVDTDNQPISLHKRPIRGRLHRGASPDGYDVLAVGQPIGWLELVPTGPNASLAMGFRPQHASSSAAAALALLIATAFEDFGVERVEVRIDTDHPHLSALAAAAGLRREGVLTGARREPDGRFLDVELWAVTRAEEGARTGRAQAHPKR
ncbi:GNAT family protein [Nocardia sp. CDC153]|uniref:GNAT family N-acetyltransferase n=1 Tax=Nocardia sp. CDC153 TaxID=3112167 RepID=UPI002DB6D968|nr:GNAT family protein [Nocardia sp. CDC153]MEC3955842.1 GNAT family protein [Nocardia sp. CDC153]